MRALALLLAALLPSAAAQAPLFADDAPLDLVLTFDVEAVTGDRSETPPWSPAVLTHTAPDGTEAVLDLGVRTRGFYRLTYLDCDVPPLRLNIRRRAAGGSVFEGQDKLKLVTHCENRSERFQQYVLQEYLIYRAYALLTEASFQTRLARITYRDAAGDRDDVTRYGFLIEEDGALAERLHGQIVERARIHPDATDREQVALMSLFQYMIGNTDWTVSTLHNVRLVYREDVAARLATAADRAESALVAVPYDFDWAGLIATPYARPDAQLGIASVRDRIYLGFCRTPEEFAAVVAHLQAYEQALYALFRDSPYLDPEVADRSVGYLTEFFEAVSTPRGIERAMRDCLGG